MTLLDAAHLTKSYSGVRVLDDVSISLERAQIHALVGENGAGKSTLIKILTGAVTAETGTVQLEGARLPQGDPPAVRRRGVSVVYQEFSLIPHLSVGDNIFLGREPGTVWLDRQTMARRAGLLLENLSVAVSPATLVSSLSIAQQQMVEIARALAFEAKVLILDEPTATLSPVEAARLFVTIRALKEAGLGILYISHRLDEICALADRVTVLRDGRVVDTFHAPPFDRSHLIRAMVGREISEEFPRRTSCAGRPVLQLQNVSFMPKVHNATFAVRQGEILGLAGLVGSGRTSLALGIVGALPGRSRVRGTIELDGVDVRFDSPADALAGGMAYVTEDRKRLGLFPAMSTAANITLSSLRELAPAAWLRPSREHRSAAAAAKSVSLPTTLLERRITSLSGGSQQKALLARFLMQRRHVLILDEPTRGVDVGARAEIYGLMNNLVAEGLAILMISSDLPEVIGMADRIAVMRLGSTRPPLDAADCTAEGVLALAAAN